MIYFAINEEYNFCKVGYTSRDPKIRVKEIQRFLPFDLTLVRQHEGSLCNEGLLHSKFINHRVKNEWYTLDVLNIKYDKKYIEPIGENYTWSGKKKFS